MKTFQIVLVLSMSMVALLSASDCDRDCKCDLEYPCDCDRLPVHNEAKAYSPKKSQTVADRTVLVCTSDSYFKRLEYDGCYPLNTSCNAVFSGSEGRSEGIYTAYKTDDPNEEGLSLNTDKYDWTIMNNNGGLQWFERAKLTECECESDILSGYSSYLAEDPLAGCCSDGTRRLEAKSYKVIVYGKCCSVCYLLQSTISYPESVHN